MATTIRPPRNHEGMQTYDELFRLIDDPSAPIPPEELVLGGTYFGYGGNIGEVATLTATDSLGRLSLLGYTLVNKRPVLKSVVQLPERDGADGGAHGDVYIPLELIEPPTEYPGHSEIDWLIKCHLTYLQRRIDLIQTKAHKLQNTAAYIDEIADCQARINLIKNAQAY